MGFTRRRKFRASSERTPAGVCTGFGSGDAGNPEPRRVAIATPGIVAAILVLGSVLAWSGAAWSAQSAPRQIDPGASCVNSKCHGDVVDAEELHWPDFTEPKQCQRCHEPDGKKHEFETDDSVNGCVRCHEEVAAKLRGAKLRHEAAEDGCLDCHDPHGGETRTLLVDVREDDFRPLCFGCHDDAITAQEIKHGPAARGACNMCHDSHASDFSALLLFEGAELCFGCHEEVAETFASAEFVHDPAEDDCTDCHNPHSGPADKMLPAVGRALCNECHDDIVDIAENAAVDHAPTTTEDECLNCHSPHATNSAPNLRKPQRELCLGCHDRRVKSGKKMLQDIEGWLEKNKVWHKPVVEDDCSGCHIPHGSENFRLLKEPFPEKFYTRFEIDKYGLCFSCHEKTVVTTERTRTLTGFRDGDRSLHYLHVNREKRGRTCRACHEVHASQRPRHIREKVPYGRWMMPINFEKNEKGGSCHPGCHELKSYDRDGPNWTGEKKKKKG